LVQTSKIAGRSDISPFTLLLKQVDLLDKLMYFENGRRKITAKKFHHSFADLEANTSTNIHKTFFKGHKKPLKVEIHSNQGQRTINQTFQRP